MIKDPAPLTGLALGDALGMPFETCKPNDPRLQGWDGRSFLGSDYHKLSPGQWTDDTLMSINLATSLLRSDGFDPEDAAREYMHGYRSFVDLGLDPRGMGKSTRVAMRNLDNEKIPWWRSGVEGAEGNGSAMRAAPIGVWCARYAQYARGSNEAPVRSAMHWARVDASITHRSDEAKEGSAAVAAAVAWVLMAVQPGVVNTFTDPAKQKLLPTVLGGLHKSRVQFAIEDVHERGQAIDRKFLGNKEALRCVLGSMPWIFQKGPSAHVVETVPTALAIFLCTTNYYEAVTTAIRMGGDTDTTAAIVGALAGAHYGYEGIVKSLPPVNIVRMETDFLLCKLERAEMIQALEMKLLARRPGGGTE